MFVFRCLFPTLILVGIFVLGCSPKCGRYKQDDYEQGRISRVAKTETWSSRRVFDGPIAIFDGAVAPLTCTYSGFTYFSRDCYGQGCIGWYFVTPFTTLAGLLGGVVNGVALIARGAGDTVTGGVFGLSYEASPDYQACDLEYWCLNGGFYSVSDEASQYNQTRDSDAKK